MTEVGHIPPPGKFAQSEVTAGMPVHIVNKSYSPDSRQVQAPPQLPPVSQQYTIPAHSHYNHPPATLNSPHFHTTSAPVPPGARPNPSHFHHAPSPLTEQLRQVLADRERHGAGNSSSPQGGDRKILNSSYSHHQEE